jgi:cell division protein FtsI (penicillin-binding protein 3)/stage V sporulation protein D (sporulation-specific penicillin-binding protein)
MTRNSKSRITFFSICILLFAILLVGKLYLVQIVSGDDFESKADRQYVQSTYDYFDRGSIYFKTKDGEQVSAATLKNGYIIAINPKLIPNPDELYQKLSSIIVLDKEEFLSKANNKNDPYEEVLKRVPFEKAEEITKLKLTGVTSYKERWRFYPGASMAAHALGFIAYKDDTLAGRYGLERYYEDTLRRNNESVFVNFFAEIFSDLKKGLTGDSSLEGDVVTSIEPSVEAYLEQELKLVRETWSSDYAGGIIMNPMNGEIYAIAVDPTFDPNNLKEEKESLIFSNRLVEGSYEMGSIIKPLTMAAGIDSGTVTANSKYYDAGFLTLNKKTIYNFDLKGRGTVSMQEVLNQSLNTGAAYVALKMGTANFAKYMFDYGVGEETGIDIPNEASGQVSNLKVNRELEYATASFGQGIALTPIQTIRALSTLGNGGKLITPHIATRINYKIGGYKSVTPGPDKQVLKKETSEEITRMLVHVVDFALRGGAVKMEHYSIAAKTGTAQIAKPGGGGYYDDRYIHSFFGYFPAYNPQFIVFLYHYYPKGVKYASETLTDPFMNIAKFLINYYQIPPDR